MLEFALNFYQTYQRFFYILIVIAVLLEGPIVILTLTFLATPLQIPLRTIFLFAIFGDAGGDILHFLAGKYGKTILNKLHLTPSSPKLDTIHQKIQNYPLREKLIIIKYTPPLTSAGLIYLGSSNLKLKDFLKATLPLCLISSIIVFSIGVFFGQYFTSKTHIFWLIVGIGTTLFILTSLIRRIGKTLIQNIEKNHHKKNQKSD